MLSSLIAIFGTAVLIRYLIDPRPFGHVLYDWHNGIWGIVLMVASVWVNTDDGMWQFLTGAKFSPEDAVPIPLGEVFTRDRSIGSLADLPRGWSATRPSRSQDWQRSQMGCLPTQDPSATDKDRK